MDADSDGADVAQEPEMGPSQSLLDRLKVLPEDIATLWRHAEPYIEALHPYIEMTKPYFRTVADVAHRAYVVFDDEILPYCTDEVTQVLFAVVMLTMGGQFAMTIASVQAFRMSGWSYMQTSWGQLRESYESAREALNEDEEARRIFGGDDEDDLSLWAILVTLKDMMAADSEAKRKLSFKRFFVIMKCVDPNKVLDAMMGVWVGIVAVLSTLRFRMVYCVSLGASIATCISTTLQKYAEEHLYMYFPEHKKWVQFGLRTSCGFVGILISLFLARFVSAFCSAIQGATLLAKVFFRYLRSQGKDGRRLTRLSKIIYSIDSNFAETTKNLDSSEAMVAWTLAVCGFAFQLWSRFDLPFLIKIPLAPVYFVENVLSLIAVY